MKIHNEHIGIDFYSEQNNSNDDAHNLLAKFKETGWYTHELSQSADKRNNSTHNKLLQSKERHLIENKHVWNKFGSKSSRMEKM